MMTNWVDHNNYYIEKLFLSMMKNIIFEQTKSWGETEIISHVGEGGTGGPPLTSYRALDQLSLSCYHDKKLMAIHPLVSLKFCV